MPDSVKDTYALPPFPTYEITTEAAWEDTVAWLIEQGIVESTASYADTVNLAFLEAIAPAAGDPAQGEVLFAARGCNRLPFAGREWRVLEPSVAGIAGRAGTRSPG